ncbi:MAG: hypothetical protein CMO08_05265 [Thalassospira sp.]|nr:hypothetical protein [Thalassospira sp.]
MIKTLILDSDGVLYPANQLSLRIISEALLRTLNDFDIHKSEWRKCTDYCKKHGHLWMLNKIRRLCCTNGISEMDFYKAHAENIDYTSIRPNIELTKYLIELKNKDVTIAVASNNHQPHLEKVLDRVFGQSSENIFSDIISGHSFQNNYSEGQFHVLKPSKLYFEELCTRFNKKPQECVFVDDTLMNINACNDLGILGIHLFDQTRLIEEIRKFLC